MKKKFFSGGRLRAFFSGLGRGRQPLHHPAPEEFRPAFLSAINEILAKQSAGADINVRQAAMKYGFLLIVIPLGEDQIDEFVYPRRFGARSIGLRNNEFGDGCDGLRSDGD